MGNRNSTNSTDTTTRNNYTEEVHPRSSTVSPPRDQHISQNRPGSEQLSVLSRSPTTSTVQQAHVTCLCPRCNRTLLAPPNAQIFRCQCGMTLRLPTPSSIQVDREQLTNLLQSHQYSASCTNCGRMVLIPAEANPLIGIVCACGTTVLTPRHFQLLLARLSSAARRAAQHAALVQMLPSFKFVKGSLVGEGSSPASCTICLSEYESEETLVTLPCFHSFHKECAEHWLKEHRSCPLCNIPIDAYLEQERELVRR